MYRSDSTATSAAVRFQPSQNHLFAKNNSPRRRRKREIEIADIEKTEIADCNSLIACARPRLLAQQPTRASRAGGDTGGRERQAQGVR